jgi:hypothetical protein
MQEDLQKIIKEINEAIFTSPFHEHSYTRYLEYVQTPIGDYVKYMGNYIYDSENDYRDYAEDEDGNYEYIVGLKEYLLGEMCAIKNCIVQAVHQAQSKP